MKLSYMKELYKWTQVMASRQFQPTKCVAKQGRDIPCLERDNTSDLIVFSYTIWIGKNHVPVVI